MGTGDTRRMNKLIRWIDRQPGYRVVSSPRSSHFRVFGPPPHIVTISKTPANSDRCWKNIVADLRRIGLTEIPKF